MLFDIDIHFQFDRGLILNTTLTSSGIPQRAARARQRITAALPVALIALLTCRAASASERHFGFSDESSVLNPGTAELEPWTTVRAGHVDYYNRVDGRLAFAYGLAKNLQGTFFWNFWSVAEDVHLPSPATQATRLTSSAFESFSTQLKYKISDPVADALGIGLSVEGSYGPLLASVEGRVIFDKQVGAVLLAANLVGEGSADLERTTQFAQLLGGTAAAGYFVTPTFIPSLEIREQSAASTDHKSSVVYLGPSLSLTTESWWATLSAEPQIVALRGASPGHHLDLNRNERLQARLLFGFHL